MKKQIRRGIFETNSSSVHAISIKKVTTEPLEFENPGKELKFSLGKFGWENTTLDTPYEKASYLWTGINCYYGYCQTADKIEEAKKIIIKAINTIFPGIKLIFENPSDDLYFYVDHSDELCDFIDSLLKSPNDLLLRYLFCSQSFIETGNDNCEDCCIPQNNSEKEFDVFIKGN